MKKIFILLISAASTTLCSQTNLVPNPSFEDTLHCPCCYGQIDFANHWSGLGSADYYNSCADSASNVNVPYNVEGYQMARTGNAYSGIYNCGFGADLREYIQVQLDSILKSQHKYCAEFYVSLGDIGKTACNNIWYVFFRYFSKHFRSFVYVHSSNNK